jgi:SAM-dependent methyltransferase
MDLPDESVRAFYGINCFHHLPEPRKFFGELKRVLVPGGGAVLIEPYYGPFASFLYRYIHKQEHFDKTQPVWESGEDPRHYMSGANQALSYIVFIRDRDVLTSEYPDLEIVHIETIGNYLRYLLSGGVNFKPLIPNWLSWAVSGTESLLRPVQWLTALHYALVLRKSIPLADNHSTSGR